MEKYITITISDGEEEYSVEFVMDAEDFDDAVNQILNDLDIY